MSEVSLEDQQHSFVTKVVDNRINDHQAWPANILKIELEGVDMYQDRTGKILEKLEDTGTVGKCYSEIDGNQIPFVTRPENNPPEPTEEVLESTKQLLHFFRQSSDFAEFAAYAALCKVCDEIGNHITAMNAFPKGKRPHYLNGVSNELDSFMQMGDEYIPVEVYNGGNYLSTKSYGDTSDKYSQLQNYSSDEEPLSNPILINRRADTKFQKQTRRKFNGVVINTDMILGCEDTHSNLTDTIDYFNLNEIVHLLPPLKTVNGQELTGEDYAEVVRDDPGVIRPPSNMAEAAEDLPDQYLKRIRGGVQLFYVNTFYRSASERTEREASLVLQAIYNQLLREGGMSRQTALDIGWDNFIDSYRQKKSAVGREEMIRDQTRRYITKLLNKKILTERNNEIHARKATHPQQTFSF